MRYPEIKNVDFAPFLGAVGQAQEQMASVISSLVNTQDRELLVGLLEQIKINSAKLEVEGPLWLAEKKASLADSVAKHKAATASQEEVLHSLAGLKEKIAAQIVVTKAKAAEYAALPKTIPAVPRAFPNAWEPTAIRLSTGEVLRDLLNGLRVEPSDLPRVIGNIWENWPSQWDPNE